MSRRSTPDPVVLLAMAQTSMRFMFGCLLRGEAQIELAGNAEAACWWLRNNPAPAAW
jgi:hypothetical protein